MGTRSCIYIFVLLQKQEYFLQRDWSCLAEAPPMTRIRVCCVVNFSREWSELTQNVQASNFSRIARFIRVIRVWCERTFWGIYLTRTARSDMALFSREDHFFHLFLPTLVNVLFLHKHVQILLVGLFLKILQTEMYCLTFKLFCYSDILQSISIC